jgi:class 3 adenylate cyclase/NAD(P)-dependent dehydrogenase (short-subunit alcohol dehydrogenase family)
MYVVDWKLAESLGLKRGEFQGRTALITGSARGIGEATAHTLAALGAEVVIVDQLVEQGQAVAAAICASGGQAKFLRCNLAKQADITQLIPRALAAFGKIDILVNNALRMDVAPVANFDVKKWDLTFAVNVRAPFLLAKAFLPGMLAGNQGTIVNIVAYEGQGLTSAYSATKSASRSLARSISQEVPPGVHVHSFSFVPGVVDTPLIREFVVPQLMAVFGLSEEATLTAISQNPGYSGLVPREHCATALVYTLAHAEEYNGQVADTFDPLRRFGMITMPEIDPNQAPSLGVAGAVSQDIKLYLTGLSDLNHDLQKRIDVRTRELEAARAQSETLLLNILPPPIAERLKHGEVMIADHYDQATVLFADIANFTPLSASLSPQKLVELLNQIFSVFDGIVGRYELEKIKTIGDAYMVVGGVPKSSVNHTERMARAALDMIPALAEVSRHLNLPLDARIGVHSGPVVAGIIGQQKFIYDLWGDTVNLASRMESHGVQGRIHCTQAVRDRLKDSFHFESRGDIEIKGKGAMPTWFLLGAAS